MSQLIDYRSDVEETDRITKEFISQQQELITVLKQQIIRLQDEIHIRLKSENQLEQRLARADQLIQILNQKITNISQNNESLLRTVHAYQRQLIRREGGPLSKLPIQNNRNTGPFHLQIVRNLKSKISNIVIEPSSKSTQKSSFAEYYGFFLQDQTVDESEVSLYNQIVQNIKPIRSSKIRSLGRKSYFHEKFRHIFWFSSIQNKQRINQKLYISLRDKYENSIQNSIPKTSIIDLDLRRMDLRLDEQKSKKVSCQIKRLLQIFELYRPDLKYVQGMSYLAWIFLIRMNSYQAFSSFTNLILSDPFVFSLYTFEEQKIKKIVAFFQECLSDKKPKLHKHMKELVVDTELFLIEWAYTLYSRTFSLRIVSKIWDLWFSEGYNTFYKVAMTVFEILEQQLLQKNENDKFVDTIRNSCYKIEENEFLKVLAKQKLYEELKLE